MHADLQSLHAMCLKKADEACFDGNPADTMYWLHLARDLAELPEVTPSGGYMPVWQKTIANFKAAQNGWHRNHFDILKQILTDTPGYPGVHNDP
jgi:hypothetical protein